MLVRAYELSFFLLFIVMLVFCSFYQRTSDIKTTSKYRRKSEYGELVVVDISKNSKTLYDLIICSECDTMKEPNVYLKHEANANVYTNMTDPRFQNNSSFDIEKSGIRLCPLIAPDLGPVKDDKAIWSLTFIEDMYSLIQPGGIHIPTECLAVEQVAIIVPIHETSGIIGFLYYIHPFLMKQQLEYQIFVILKPNATKPYKRGELFNIGFKEALTYRPARWDCVIFHDAHLVPLDTRNLYRCTNNPRKLITNFKKPYKFGGVVALRPRQFMKANGFSNDIWSNDGDYIDMYKRLKAAHFTVETNVSPFGKYAYFKVLRQENHKLQKHHTNRSHYLKDGLSTVSYNKTYMKMKKFYTLIVVETEFSK